MRRKEQIQPAARLPAVSQENACGPTDQGHPCPDRPIRAALQRVPPSAQLFSFIRALRIDWSSWRWALLGSG